MTTTASAFQPREYWSERITGNGSLANVGHVALGDYNRHAYPLRLEALSRAVAGLVPAAGRVFDGGFGEGVYLNYWLRRGALHVSGLDFSPRAVLSAKDRHPGFDLRLGDLSSPDDLAGFGRFDVVTAIDVLYHVVDDLAWAAALGNLLSLVGQGGVLVASDKFPARGAWQPMAHVRRRSLAMWRSVLAGHGFEIIRRVPVFVLMDDPITCGSHPWLGRLAWVQWKGLTKLIRLAAVAPWLHRGAATAVAGIQLPVERLLLRLLAESPNLELVVARRVTGGAAQPA
jgi:SAM-dependent methyltransferase